MILRTVENGKGTVCLDQSAGFWKINVKGETGTDAIIDALRDPGDVEELVRYTPDQREAVIRLLTDVWEQSLDPFATTSGLVTGRGIVRFFKKFNPPAGSDLAKRGYHQMSGNPFPGPEIDLSGISTNQVLFVVGPGFAARLRTSTGSVGRSRDGFYLTLPGQPLGRGSFMDGVTDAFSKTFEAAFAANPTVPKLVSSRSAVVQRFDDHIRGRIQSKS